MKLVAPPIIGIGATSKFAMYVKENMKDINVGTIVTNWNNDLKSRILSLQNQELTHINDELATYIELNEVDLFLSDSIATKYSNNVYQYLKIIPKEITAHFFGLINSAANNGKTWQHKLIVNSHPLQVYAATVLSGKDEHDKEVDRIINGEDEVQEWNK